MLAVSQLYSSSLTKNNNRPIRLKRCHWIRSTDWC